jgi:hypothetical protein
MDATQAKLMFDYLHWFFLKLMGESGPVINTNAPDLLVHRQDPLLKVLLKAGSVSSANSGVYYSASEQQPTHNRKHL